MRPVHVRAQGYPRRAPRIKDERPLAVLLRGVEGYGHLGPLFPVASQPAVPRPQVHRDDVTCRRLQAWTKRLSYLLQVAVDVRMCFWRCASGAVLSTTTCNYRTEHVFGPHLQQQTQLLHMSNDNIKYRAANRKYGLGFLLKARRARARLEAVLAMNETRANGQTARCLPARGATPIFIHFVCAWCSTLKFKCVLNAQELKCAIVFHQLALLTSLTCKQ